MGKKFTVETNNSGDIIHVSENKSDSGITLNPWVGLGILVLIGIIALVSVICTQCSKSNIFNEVSISVTNKTAVENSYDYSIYFEFKVNNKSSEEIQWIKGDFVVKKGNAVLDSENLSLYDYRTTFKAKTESTYTYCISVFKRNMTYEDELLINANYSDLTITYTLNEIRLVNGTTYNY